MAQFPALPLWTDALLGDTQHLSTVEFGAYLLMLIVAWRTPTCDLLDDDVYLAKITRLGGRWNRYRAVLRAFWTVNEAGRLAQKRLTRERAYVEEQSAKQADRAKKRWERNPPSSGGEPPPSSGGKSPQVQAENEPATPLKNNESDNAPVSVRHCRGNAPTPTPIPTKTTPAPPSTTHQAAPALAAGKLSSFSAEQSTGDANPAADTIVAHFLAERERLWPSESRQPSPRVTLRSQAIYFLGQGGPAELVREMLTCQMGKAAAAGKSAPSNLRAYHCSIGDAIASHRAQPQAPAPRERRGETLAEQDAVRKRWREENVLQLSEHRKGGCQ